MERMIIEKSPGLEGSIRVMGAKNSALPILAATLLGTEEIILEDVPSLKDVEVMIEVLRSLGSEVEYVDKATLRINSANVDKTEPPYELMSKMRASFLVLGPLLTRLGVSRTSMPGGCAGQAHRVLGHTGDVLGDRGQRLGDRLEILRVPLRMAHRVPSVHDEHGGEQGPGDGAQQTHTPLLPHNAR